MYEHPEKDNDEPVDEMKIAPASNLPTFEDKGGELVFVHKTEPLTQERIGELHELSQEAGIAKIRLQDAFESRKKEYKASLEKWERQYNVAVRALDIGHEVVTHELHLFYRLKEGTKVWKDGAGLVVKTEPMTKSDYSKVSAKPRK